MLARDLFAALTSCKDNAGNEVTNNECSERIKGKHRVLLQQAGGNSCFAYRIFSTVLPHTQNIGQHKL